MAGVSRKTIYNYFENREALIEESADAWMSKTLEALKYITQEEGRPFIDRLNSIMERGFAELRGGGQLIGINPGGSANYRFSRVRRTMHESLTDLVLGLLENAVAEGLISPSFEAKRLTLVIINVLVGLSALDGFEDQSFSKADILSDSLRAIVGGILTEKGAKAIQDSFIFKPEGIDA